MRYFIDLIESFSENDGIVIYYGTSVPAETIRREGLKTGRHRAVFLTDNPDLAIDYAETDRERSGLDSLTLVSVNSNQLDQALLRGDIDHTLEDDWRDSLSETDQCM